MRVPLPTFLILFMALPSVLPAQHTNPRQALTGTQQLGQRLFNRECAVCHAPPLITSNAYAPVLYEDVIEGQEEPTREIIRKGLPNLMPGFRIGLKPAEIDAIVDYLKTVPKPSPKSQAGQAGENEKRAD
jgi:mono/diheme cytochrome c family protein